MKKLYVYDGIRFFFNKHDRIRFYFNLFFSSAAAKKNSGENRSSPTNLMSASVPNLPSSMEQTASLLDTFAAVARRNLAAGGPNNLPRNANTTSLVRMALSNSPSK